MDQAGLEPATLVYKLQHKALCSSVPDFLFYIVLYIIFIANLQ
jgi:hypothetical protein